MCHAGYRRFSYKMKKASGLSIEAFRSSSLIPIGEAFEWLERAYSERVPMAFLRIYPDLAPVRNPRYADSCVALTSRGTAELEGYQISN
jgi:hypothetical protein